MAFTKKIRQIGMLLAFSLCLLSYAPTSFAEYDNGVYGRCAYGVSTSCNKHTTTTTPTGLQVTVNLKDGQVITTPSYDVTITPLNGQGSSFTSADVYIDGVKVATVYPESNGTATWHWNTETYPSGNIKIVILDSGGNRTEMPFSVKISPAEQQQPATTKTIQGSSGSSSGGAWFGSQVVDAVTGKSKQFIRVLPSPVVKAFPYLLFLLIVVEGLILAYQTRRELRAQHKLKLLAEREREIVSMKQKFTMLVSHYLRTPLTVLRGGAEGYAAEPNSGETATKLSGQVAVIHETIESIIAQSNDTPAPADGASEGAGTNARLGIGKLLAVWLPVLVIGLLSVMFVYLANSIDKYDANVIAVMTQSVVFSVLVVGVYFLVRQLQLHRRNVDAARLVLDQERSVQRAQDAVVSEAATSLMRENAVLGSVVALMPKESINTKFVQDGYNRLTRTIDKFVIASQLKGAVSTDAYTAVPLEEMVKQASSRPAAAAAEKHVVIKLNDSGSVVSRNTGLLTLVLETLLDNAVSYSTESGVVEVGKAENADEMELYVADHGEGLAADKIHELFQPFNRIEDVETFNREGLGFSLYLDKLIMRYLGGDISVESVPRELTRFVLKLPEPTAEAA
jgi:signal transduction histidine kinase